MNFVPTDFQLAAAQIRQDIFKSRNLKMLRALQNFEVLLKSGSRTETLDALFFDTLFSAAVIVAGEKGYTLFCRLASPQPFAADKGLLATAVLNMVSNACLYSADRTARIELETVGGRIRIAAANKVCRPLRIPAFETSLGMMSAKRAAKLICGSFSVLAEGERVTAVLSFPALKPSAQSAPQPTLAELITDPFSPIRVGLSTL